MQVMVLTGRADGADQDELLRWIDDEIQAVRQGYADGVIRHVWHRDDRPGAVLLIEAADVAAARDLVVAFPLVGRGLVTVDATIPLKPYAGFGPR